MKIAVWISVLGLVIGATGTAQAQQRNFAGRGGAGRNAAGTLPLPKGINRVIGLDAYNAIIAETQDENGRRDYTLIPILHVYSGGIAAIFGGTSIPTLPFVSPGALNSGVGGNGGGFGVSGFGGNSGGNAFGGGNNFGGQSNGSVGFSQTTVGGPNGTANPVATFGGNFTP